MSNGRAAIASEEPETLQTTVFADFLALIKIGIVNSNLITTFTGFWLAMHFLNRSFFDEINVFVYTMLGTALIIAGSAAMNNYIDRDIDPFMASKKARPTVTGRFKPGVVLLIALIFLVLGEILLFSASLSAGVWGLAGIISYVVLYTMWSKRKHVSNTVVGSISGAIPPIIGWAAIQPSLSFGALALFLIMFAWQPPHFYALAIKRTEEYKAAGIPMLPVIKGFRRTKFSMIFWIILLFPLPFLLLKLGTAFIILATALNVGWFILAMRGFKVEDDLKWAKGMFVYSLNYMTILFVSMIIFSIFS